MTYDAQVLGADSVRDLALIRICCGEFRALPFGNLPKLMPGDEVFAMGYPLGLPGEATVTKGIVSAIRFDEKNQRLVIQTDAAINPGSSGGPMLSKTGEILGINTFRREETESGRPVDNVGFAIAAPTIQEQLNALKTSPPPPIPGPTSEPTPTPGGEYAFGPLNGELRHDPGDGFIETKYAEVTLDDTMLEATFTNPYDASEHAWSYGFILRRDPNRDNDSPYMLVVVDSDRNWVVEAGSSGSYSQIAGGMAPNLRLGSGQQNHVMIVALEERGWLFVNRVFIAAFDLGEFTSRGDVAVLTGYYTGSEMTGAMTSYEDFSGYDLRRRYGPTSGTIDHVDDDRVGAHRSGLDTLDFVVEATFRNPVAGGRDPEGGPYDYGFIFRNPVFNHLEVLGIHSRGNWAHDTRSESDDEYTELGSGSLSNWLDGAGSRNHLLLIAMAETGWFFVNDQLAATLVLDFNLKPGNIAAIAGFYTTSSHDVEFGDFQVWAP